MLIALTALTLAIMHDMQLFDGPVPLLSSDCRKVGALERVFKQAITDASALLTLAF